MYNPLKLIARTRTDGQYIGAALLFVGAGSAGHLWLSIPLILAGYIVLPAAKYAETGRKIFKATDGKKGVIYLNNATAEDFTDE